MYARGPERTSKPGTLIDGYLEGIAHDRPDALRVRQNGVWHEISDREITERVRAISLGLASLGLVAGDRAVLLSENRPEWAMTDIACLMLGAVTVPIYPTLPAAQIPYLLNDSGAVVAFVSTQAQAEKLGSIREQVPSLRHVIVFDAGAHAFADGTLAEIEERGRREDTPEARAQWEARGRAIAPSDLATIIYTSGTTGAPKGVMLTHDNFHSNIEAVRRMVPIGPGDIALSFLPLSHVFQRTGDYLLFRAGASISYVESFDLVPIAMSEVRPTVAFSVPRLYEKMYARVLENALAGGALKKRIFFWARGVGEGYSSTVLSGQSPSPGQKLARAVAQKLVFSKLQARTGGRLKFFVSGGAPLAPEIARFFHGAGLTILEGYGLTETSPVITVNTLEAHRIGAVGRLVEGVEVRIADDGEILTRGPHVMRGYFNKPEATAEAIDAEGWFHTGDIGVLEDGFLRITDRKKDIIVTAAGKNIAPQPIENLVKTNKYVSQAVMLGDRRKFPILLVVPNFEQLEKWAKYKELIWTDRAQLLQMPTVHAKMDKEVRGQLTGLASFETPKKIGLLEHDFTVDSGELTITLKVKRRVIEQRYAAVIEALYRNGEG